MADNKISVEEFSINVGIVFENEININKSFCVVSFKINYNINNSRLYLMKHKFNRTFYSSLVLITLFNSLHPSIVLITVAEKRENVKQRNVYGHSL